ncbi:MAG TPA: AMP-binding protein [Gammaproteobacteria bacterium]|nr:AMP-binding protein [Gammaproteobacteria bacterium]
MRDLCVHEVFERQRTVTPSAPAAWHGERAVTYDEVGLAARRVAMRLRERGVTPGSLVGLCTTRSPQALAAILGTLEAGAAFVALDPETRLDDALRPDVVVSDQSTRRRAEAYGLPCVCLPLGQDGEEGGAAANGGSPESATCVLLGRDAGDDRTGIVLDHRQIVSAAHEAVAALEIDRACIVLSTAGLDDPRLLLEMLVSWSIGGALRLVDNLLFVGRMPEPGATTVLFADPHAVEDLLEHSVPLRGLSRLVLTGDIIGPDLVRQLEGLGVTRTLCSVGHPAASGWIAGGSIEPGRENVFAAARDGRGGLRVLGPDLRELPPEVGGDVYAEGPTVARRYWRAERLEGPLTTDAAGTRLLRTGFVGRKERDGGVRLEGRKTRRHWLEGRYVYAEAIEALLLRVPGIGSATVAVDDNGLRIRLAPARGASPAEAERAARRMLAEGPTGKLPIGSVTVLASGGLDRSSSAPRTESPPAGTATERALARVWRTLLANPDLELSRNFFDAGANSLMAALACSQLSDELGVVLTIVDAYNHPTITELARAIDGRLQSSNNGGAP